MILLPHGCTCSQPAVNPKNWNTSKHAINKPWRITYYFRDPEFKKQYPKGRLVPIKGMNEFRTIEERREITQKLLDEELYDLKINGYNPITKTFNGPDINLDFDYDIHPETKFCDALESAFKKLDVADCTRRGVSYSKKYFIQSCAMLNLDILKIKDVKRKHVRYILDHQSKRKKYSAYTYNKNRTHLMMLFKILIKHEAIENNPIIDISKKKTILKLRKILSEDDVKRVMIHLKENYITFWRYSVMFFHSGSRSTELINLQRKDVYLNDQTYKVLVKKGQQYIEELRAINVNALPLWKEICSGAKNDDYLFSKGLTPGPTKIDAWQISKRWREHVKKKLGITEDFYAFKHLHTTKVIDKYNRDLAAGINGHKTTKMNDKHYDIFYKQRMLDDAKKINISL